MDLVQIPTPKYITGYAESRIGGRMENQDSYGYAETPFGFLVTVCDGMGGGPGGKTASSIAVKEILQGVIEGNKEEELSNIVIKAVRRANMAIIEKGDSMPELKGMGSTCTLLLINEECAIVAHVGDSRVYQLRGKEKVFRTFDHSMVFSLVKQGVITEEQARLSAQSNVITRALGLKPDIEVDVAVRPYLSGDRFMLCSDGIHGTMPEKELIGYVADRKSSLGAVTDNIATTVDGIGCMDGGGHDNLTIALIETNINSKKKDKMNKNTKILIVVLALVCAISLIFNFMPRSKNSSDEVSELQQKVKVLDSVNKVLERNVADLQGEVKMLKSDSVSNFDKVERQQKLIDRLKEDTAYLRKKLLRAEAQKVQKPKTEAQKESNKKKR